MDIKLKPEKRKRISINKITELFINKKKRYFCLLLFILPILIIIGIFGYIAYDEAKDLLSLLTGNQEIKDEYKIEAMNYILRDNATDIQVEYFAELKDACEVTNTSDAVIAGYICKNYIADFYTWTNKQGQYDVGGMYYIYDGENKDGVDYKPAYYTNVRDTFYKYLSDYIKEYGVKNLLEVESVEVISAEDSPYKYCINEQTGVGGSEAEGWYKIYEDVEYDAYLVSCKWAYKPSEKFDTSKYATSMNFVVIKRNGRYEIVEASENKIDVKQFIKQEETIESDESESEIESEETIED